METCAHCRQTMPSRDILVECDLDGVPFRLCKGQGRYAAPALFLCVDDSRHLHCASGPPPTLCLNREKARALRDGLLRWLDED